MPPLHSHPNGSTLLFSNFLVQARAVNKTYTNLFLPLFLAIIFNGFLLDSPNQLAGPDFKHFKRKKKKKQEEETIINWGDVTFALFSRDRNIRRKMASLLSHRKCDDMSF